MNPTLEEAQSGLSSLILYSVWQLEEWNSMVDFITFWKETMKAKRTMFVYAAENQELMI